MGKLRSVSLVAGAALSLLLFTVNPAHAGSFYASDREGNLYSINTSTGAASLIGGPIGPNGATEIVYNPISGAAYVQGNDGSFTINPFSVATGIGGLPLQNDQQTFNGLAYVNSIGGLILYGAGVTSPNGPSDLFRIDLNHPVPQIFDIGPTGFGPISGLAYSQSSGIMYGVTGGSGTSSLLVGLNLTTGIGTVIGDTSIKLGAITFAQGVLYGVTNPSSGGFLYTLDPATGSSTLVGATGTVEGMTGLMYVPEPSSLLDLAASGAALLLLIRRKV